MSTVVESSVIMLSRGMLSSASKIEKKLFFFFFEFDQLHHEMIDSVPQLCRAKTNRMQTSPPRDLEAIAKLQARIKYNPAEVAKSKYCGDDSQSRMATIYITFDRLQTVDGPVVHPRVKCPHPRSTQRWANYLGAVYVGWSHHCNT